ncbi:hypothetical protein KUTeg_015037 [Tegillarca granosa]|uniref:Uncharacterized protein n=1 Tax=Tegillarca granosa TaxID=220873 RepID=A0ABQ9ENZ0_TEGGR|nr:hypothetical protein KUTeg_015037 [Tegillarca granosa]
MHDYYVVFVTEKKRKKRVPQTDARRFHCDNCHKSFKHKHHLREHMHLHTGEQPFECKTCGRKFSHSGSLSQHRQRSCSSGTPCQTRQRNSNAKTGNSRKSSSPRLNTNVTDHKIDEDMKKSPQENEVSPPVTKSKKAVSPRSNLSDQKRSMEYIDIKTESFSSPVKSVGRFVAGETHTVSPDSVMYKSGLKSHDIPVTLKQPDMSSDGVNYMTLDSSVTESLDVKPLVKTEGNSFIQHPSDFLSKICPEQSSVVKTEKVIIKQEEHVCLVCKKTFSGAQCLHVHMRMHTRSEMPFWCEVCSQGFPQNIQLQCHLGSEEHQRKQAQKLQESSALGTAISTVVSAEPPLPTVTSVQSENAEPTELSFSKPVLSQMINTPSWDMFTSKSTTSLPSISELMSSVTTHSSRKKETMSLAQQSVISDRILMSGNSDSSYSSGLQLMSSAPDEVIQQCTPKIHLYDPNAPSLSNDKLPMMQQIELSQNQAKLKLVSSENLTNASPTSSTSPVSSNIQQSSTIIQSQHSYLPQPSFSQHSPGQAAAPSSYGTYPAMNQVTTTEQDSALKALCSFTEKPIPSDESLAGVTGNDNSILTEQKNPSPEASGETSVVYNYAQSWNGWNNWNGAYPMYGAPGQTQNWNGSFVVPMASSWQGYPETNTNGGVPTSASSGSQMNSGIPTNTEQKVWNSVKSSNPNLSVGEMNRLIGQMWRGLPEDEKNQFLEDYSVEKEKYKVEYEKFRSSPEFQIWLASNIDKNSNSKAEQLEDRQDYRQFIVKAT